MSHIKVGSGIKMDIWLIWSRICSEDKLFSNSKKISGSQQTKVLLTG